MPLVYTVRLTTSARRALDELRQPTRDRVRRALRQLRQVPRPAGAKLLSGNRPERIWRIRVGDYRVLYEIRDDELLVLVIRIRHRRDAYRGGPPSNDRRAAARARFAPSVAVESAFRTEEELRTR